MDVSVEAKALLLELRGRPEFHEILDSIKIEKAPLYKPVRTNDSNVLNPNIQKDNWMFDSGAYRENMRVIKLLSGD